MDIAKYIGLFLLKNHFCYIHGLGNLELKKKSASYENNELQAPRFDVVLTPTGSIDDTLANFIATNEQTSISKASNSLREFSIQSRSDLAAGKEVVIPAIGKFVEQNGKIQFITDPNLQKQSAPIQIHQVKKQEEMPVKKPASPNLPKEYSGTTVNWGKIVIWVLILGVVITAVIFAIRLVPTSQETEPVAIDSQKATIAPPQDTVLKASDTAALPDSSQKISTPAPVATTTGGMMNYKIVLNEYNSLARAEKRIKQLTTYGNTVALATKDSASYYVVMPMSSLVADTAHVLDSIRKKFNPSGVRIYR